MATEEVYFTEALYHEMIGRFVSATELLNKRLASKDKYIASLEVEIADLKAKLASATEPGKLNHGKEKK